jgi:HAD superfamily hydrolase (TIGR01509 family)
MIQHVSFDIGNVAARLDEKAAAHVCRTYWPKSDAQSFRRMREAHIPGDANDYWRLFQNGTITDDFYLQKALEANGIPINPRNKTGFTEALVAFQGVPYGPIEALVHELKRQGYGTSVLSNNNPIGWNTPGARLKDDVDVAVVSYKVGISKPDQQMYHILLNAIHADDPATVVFVDDKLANVTAANNVGIIGFHFDISGKRTMYDAYQDLCRYLKSNGVQIN